MLRRAALVLRWQKPLELELEREEIRIVDSLFSFSSAQGPPLFCVCRSSSNSRREAMEAYKNWVTKNRDFVHSMESLANVTFISLSLPLSLSLSVCFIIVVVVVVVVIVVVIVIIFISSSAIF
ncbi:hypothetical protein ACLOJK_005254 [Asimina triloba]